jgi:hypothetical protein
MKMKGKVCDIQWDESDDVVDLMKLHTDFLEAAKDNKKVDAIMAMYLLSEPWYDDKKMSIKTILPILEIGSVLAPVTSDESTSMPRDFFGTLVRDRFRFITMRRSIWISLNQNATIDLDFASSSQCDDRFGFRFIK